MSDPIRLSVALVTRNRPESLRSTLESLHAQENRPHEVVISDDSDTEFIEATRALAALAGARWQAGPRRGLYANRNAAALACTGTHVRTMDDDHTFPPGHLACCLDAVRRDSRAVWACDENSYLDGRLHRTAQAAPQLHRSGVGGPVADPDDCWAIADGATIYPREIFTRGLRMVEAFGYGSSYLEFGALLYRHGYRSRLLRTTFVEHRTSLDALAAGELRSRLFASLCFNLRFRRNVIHAARYILAYAAIRQPSLSRELPALIRLVRARWGAQP